MKSLLFLTIFVLATCSAAKISPRIIGGSEVSINQVPWQVALLRTESWVTKDTKLKCGGVIIGNTWILTAQQCTKDIPAWQLSVRVGSSEWRNGGKELRVLRKIEHDQYNVAEFHDNDYALLQLTEPLNFTASVKSIALANSDAPLTTADVGLISGWGSLASGDKPQKLYQVQVDIFAKEACTKTRRQICTGTRGNSDKGSCYSDGGGPLSVNRNNVPVLYGVSSWVRGSRCGQSGIASSMYADVRSVRSWIQENTGI